LNPLAQEFVTRDLGILVIMYCAINFRHKLFFEAAIVVGFITWQIHATYPCLLLPEGECNGYQDIPSIYEDSTRFYVAIFHPLFRIVCMNFQIPYSEFVETKIYEDQEIQETICAS